MENGENNKADGYIYIQYSQITKEPLITEKITIDQLAKDKFAPAILELYLNGIKGDKTKYEIEMIAEDYGTVYEHYVAGELKEYNMYVTSNIETTEVITGIAGYSWKIDKDEYGKPDDIIGYDNDSNKTTVFPKTISTDYLDKEYYLHAKAVDNAGNWGDTVHLKLETTTITLTSHYSEYADSNGYGPNYVPLTWENSNKNEKFFYKLFQKNEDKSEWSQVSTNYGKAVKVLNVYPNVGNNLKGWMEEPNNEEPKGYGKGLIKVDEVKITDFNENPTKYLIKNGEYQYDVIMFGSWDCNNKKDLSKAAALATEEFIKTGRGVLFGHDTIINWSKKLNHTNFNYLAKYIKATPTRNNARIGSNTVKVIKKGFLTKYPYDIETRNLTVPYTHTSAVLVYSDIWIKLINITYTEGADIGYNNYYLAAWNNCAFIRTGHSNGAATADEQKIIANTLFYLGQVTDDTNANVYTAEDLEAPEISDITIKDNKQENRLEFNVEGIDYGTEYDHYVTGMKLLTAGTYYSNTVHTTVKTGINKFQYTINNSKTEYSGNEYEVKAIDKEKCKINIDKSYIGKYLHIRAVDNAGNVGAVTDIYIDGARTISREEKNETEELYCVEEDILIPAEYDGTQSDATIEIGENTEILRWPLNLQKIFEVYIEDGAALRNPYTSDGISGFADKSNTLGRYLIERVPGTVSGKKGNASEAYAYILSHYTDNNIEDSESQNALYEIIAEEKGSTTDTNRRNTLYYEAKEYAKFREILKSKGGFIPSEVTHKINVGYNIENKQYIIGPFEIEYVRNYSKINDGKGNTKKVEFSGIGVVKEGKITEEKGIKIYDQNGELINPNSWEIAYDNKQEQEKTRGETYSEYAMPLPGEEFYIKLNRTGNENVTEISKIQIEYYEMEADAKYTILNGNYSEITWNAKQNSNICEGGTLCPHGRTYKHTVGHTYYVSSEITAANLHSQRLLELEWATREYKTYTQTLTLNVEGNPDNPSGGEDPDNPGGGEDPDNPSGGEDPDNPSGGENEPTIKLTMNFAGSIWNDKNENISNGIKETGEAGIKGVEVFLYNATSKKQEGYTITDEKGNYKFEKVPVGKYYIEYIYDGQTYKTTKSFAQGSVEEYKSNGNRYGNISIVEETETARQELNNRFYEIKEGEAIGTNGNKTSLTYKETGKTSSIVTREENSEKAYQEFQIAVSTANEDIYFPATNTIIVDGIPYLIIGDNYNISVGLSEREKTDENLRLDVYQTIFSIKGVRNSYIHSQKNIRDINSNKIVKEYIQKVNPDDYAWRLEDYASNEKYEEIKDLYGSGAECELETYVEYMIVLRNSGENDIAYITELADYYDKTLEYKENYRDFDISSWIIIRNDDETESTYTGGNNKEEIKWSENSRYGDTNEYSKDFNKIYANLEKYGIKKGQYAEIHIIFRVLKDENGNIMLDSGEGKKNAAEINGYRSLETETGKVTGLIDKDSKPGDLDPRQEVEVYEDDEDKAPNYKLQLGYSNGNNGGNNGDKNNGDNNGNNGNNSKVETDENGNVIGYGNTIEGNVWEDIKEKVIEEDGRKISNGIKEAEEPLVDDVKVELIETISGYSKKTGKYKEIEITLDQKTVRTGKELLLTDKDQSTGAYRFSHLTGGTYKVRFTYGEKEQLEKNLKYNGQDYQALSSAQIYNRDTIENSYENSEIMILIDNSNSMSGNKMTKVKTVSIELIEKLKAKLPGIKIGVVNFNETANVIGKIGTTTNELNRGIKTLQAGGETAIGRGIEKATQGYGEGKTKLMVIITDGQETVEEEKVIERIEELRQKNIELISVLTGKSENIFGTQENARYGKVYEIISTEEIQEKMISEIYEKIKNQSEVEADRSLGKDIEGNKENPEPGTRRWQIEEYQEMTYKKGETLNIEGIDKLTGEERSKRIEELSNTTYMKAESKNVTFDASNVGADKIHEVNQALVERPKTRLELREEIAGIKITLSDGEVIIDTAKGLSKNVMGLDIPNAPVSVYMDEEIMQGATVEITYKVVVENTGEIDRLSNYFEGESDDTITTTAKVIYAYINQNIVYREDSQTNASWQITEVKDPIVETELSGDTIKDVKNGTMMMLRTDGLKEIELYPIGSKELKQGEGEYKSEIGTELVLSRLISPENDETTNLTYDCTMEITVRGNAVGRRMIGAIPGNHRTNITGEEGTTISLEPDEAKSRRVLITKPLGENKNTDYILYIAGGLSAIGLYIIIRKKKR